MPIKKTKKQNRDYMPASEIRNWLGLYVLFLTGGVGAFFFLAPEWILPLDSPDKNSSIEIVVPFLLGQVAAVYRYYSNRDNNMHKRLIHLPRWVVRAPPIMVTVILMTEFTIMIYGNVTRKANFIPSPETFKGLLTFCVALLNSSTVFVLTRYFDTGKEGKAPSSQNSQAHE